MAKLRTMAGWMGAVILLSAMMAAQTPSAGRYDGGIQQKVTQQLAAKEKFRNVQTSVEDGIVTLRGTVGLYQDKVDAAKKAARVEKSAGVRNLIEVAGPGVSDAELAAKLAEKLRYDREGYDNTFNYFAIGVKDGAVTVTGETLSEAGRDSALAEIQRMPGVKDVVSDVTVSPVSIFDDGLRVRTARALYRDPVLSKYALDPQRPIRIIVDRGTVRLYGTVQNSMDRQIAGVRANEVFGAFRVENHLTVE